MEIDIEVAGGMAVTALIFSFIAIIVAIVSSGNSHNAPESVSGSDLRVQVEICTPVSATWEQELACTQAVYGILGVMPE